MSEYIEIETELDEEASFTIHFFTNLLLTRSSDPEIYDSHTALAEGSPLAQALVPIEGIIACEVDGHNLTIEHDPMVPDHAIIADVSAAIKDFFL